MGHPPGGAFTAVGGGAVTATGVGAPVGVGAVVVGGAIAVHGASEVATATGNLFKSLHGNTAGSQPAQLYEKYDKDGNFEKHGVSQDAQKRYTKTEVDGGEVRVTDSGPRKEMLAKERDLVETKPGPKNKEKWAGKRKDDVDP